MLVIFHQTKPIFELWSEFDKSDLYMKFGGNLVINDSVRVSTRANRKAAILSAILFIIRPTKPY